MSSPKTASEEVWYKLCSLLGIERGSFWKRVQMIDYGASQLTIPITDSENKIASISITINYETGVEPEQQTLFN